MKIEEEVLHGVIPCLISSFVFTLPLILTFYLNSNLMTYIYVFGMFFTLISGFMQYKYK